MRYVGACMSHRYLMMVGVKLGEQSGPPNRIEERSI